MVAGRRRGPSRACIGRAPPRRLKRPASRFDFAASPPIFGDPPSSSSANHPWTSSLQPIADSIAPRATFTSIRGARFRAPSSPMRIPTTRASAPRFMSAIATRRRILRKRLGDVTIETATYGQILTRNGVELSFHPAGHVLGSAQVRVALNGEIWVASGDYKLESDGVSPAFEPLRCHAFITESTFGLPIYRWRPQARDFRHDRRLAAREYRCRTRKHPVRLCARQGAAGDRACRPDAWARLSVTARSRRSMRFIARRGSPCRRPVSRRRSNTSAISPAPSFLRRRQPLRALGSSASATIPTRWRAAGCRCAETVAGAGSTAALRYPTMPTGRASSRPSRRRARSAFS